MRPALRPAMVALGVVAVQAALLACFTWPAINAAPRDLPVVVAGSPATLAAVTEQLQKLRPDGFDVTRVADAATADDALRDRTAYAAFIPSSTGMSVHVASAASPSVATLFTQQSPESVVDVVPVDPDDPRGAGLASALLPLILTSIVAGAALFLLVTSRRGRLVGLVTFATAAGLAAAASLQYGFDALPGEFLANAAVLALLTGALASTVTGLAALLGPAGIGVGALVAFVLGNPLSAINSAPELLPQPWGQVGQLLPPGAGGTLLRSVAYFDGAGGAVAAWVLAAWTIFGLALLLLSPKRIQKPTESTETAPAEPTANRPAAPQMTAL